MGYVQYPRWKGKRATLGQASAGRRGGLVTEYRVLPDLGRRSLRHDENICASTGTHTQTDEGASGVSQCRPSLCENSLEPLHLPVQPQIRYAADVHFFFAPNSARARLPTFSGASSKPCLVRSSDDLPIITSDRENAGSAADRCMSFVAANHSFVPAELVPKLDVIKSLPSKD